jgi:hypothetical protein
MQKGESAGFPFRFLWANFICLVIERCRIGMKKQYLEAGKIVSTHGVRGEVRCSTGAMIRFLLDSSGSTSILRAEVDRGERAKELGTW